MSEEIDYGEYEEAIAFEGNFQGEPIITRALIYSDGNIQLHQGPKTGDNKFIPDDIIGLETDELQEVLTSASKLDDVDFLGTDDELEKKLGRAITEAAKESEFAGNPYRIIAHVVTKVEEELGIEIPGEEQPLREYCTVDSEELSESLVTPEDLISEDELEEVEDRLEGTAEKLFQNLVDNALNRDKFYEILNEERVGTDWHRVRETLEDVGGYRIIDIRKSEKARELGGEEL